MFPPADVTSIRRPARAPNLNAYTERFVRTIKESCLERMVLIGEGSRRVAKLSVEEPDAAEPARPDLWGGQGQQRPWSTRPYRDGQVVEVAGTGAIAARGEPGVQCLG